MIHPTCIKTKLPQARLERARELLAGRACVERTRLAIFAAGGFTADLQDEATRRSDVVLVDPERLYAGD